MTSDRRRADILGVAVAASHVDMFPVLTASQLQVPDGVVAPVAVDVVDGLVSHERTTNQPGHDESVLENVTLPVGHADERVAGVEQHPDVAFGGCVSARFEVRVRRPDLGVHRAAFTDLDPLGPQHPVYGASVDVEIGCDVVHALGLVSLDDLGLALGDDAGRSRTLRFAANCGSGTAGPSGDAELVQREAYGSQADSPMSGDLRERVALPVGGADLGGVFSGDPAGPALPSFHSNIIGLREYQCP